MLDRIIRFALRHPRWVIVAAVLAVWGQSVRFDFVWDDYFFIQENQAIRSLTNVPRMFTDLDAQAEYSKGFLVYRPLRTAHYAVLHFLGGGKAGPALFHFANLAWHAAAAMLVFSVALRLLQAGPQAGADAESRTTGIALAAGLAFAVHPVLSETVCWVKGLDDIMAAVFALLATRLLLEGNGGFGGRYWAATAAFVAAIYSKESAVPWVAVAGLIFWKFHRRSFGRSVVLTLPMLALTVLSLWHRHAVMGRSSQTAPISGTHAQTLLDMLPTVAPYLRLVLGIPPFCIDYSYLKGGYAPLSGEVRLGTVLIFAAILLTVWALCRENHRLAGVGLAWFFLFMLPVSNLVPMMQYMAERFLYLPLIGLVLAAALVLGRAANRKVATAVTVAACAVWAATAWSRSWIWQDEVTLFVRTHLECPPMQRVENNAVSAVLKQPQMRSVFRLKPLPGELPRIDVAPPTETARADWPRVLATLREMERLFPTNAAALEAAGIGFALAGRPADAVPAFRRATEAAPTSTRAWQNLGQALADAQQPDEAVRALLRSLELDPNNVGALKTLGSAHWKLGQFERAAGVYERLTKLEPDDPEHARWLREARAKAGGR